jgi:hypothetical protein
VKADDTFEKVCELYKDSWPPAYLYRARIQTYRYQGDTTFIAAPVYEKYLSILTDDQKVQNKPAVIEAYRYLSGKAFLLEKDITKTEGLVKEILKIDPQNADALQLLESLQVSPATKESDQKPKIKS